MTDKAAPADPRKLQIVPSGIAGLDTILRGGFLHGGITIIQGKPGAGKTIFGNQLCFNHAANGQNALFVTLLAETHTRMLLHIGNLEFFDGDVIPDQLAYLSAFPVMEAEGLSGLLKLLRHEIRARRATLDERLRYWWLMIMPHDQSQRLPGKFVIANFKPVLWYVKQHRRGRTLVPDMLKSPAKDKAAHQWAQGDGGV